MPKLKTLIQTGVPLLFLISFIILYLGTTAFQNGSASAPDGKPSGLESDDITEAINQAMVQTEEVLGYEIFDVRVDEVRVSKNGGWATARLQFLDPETGQLIPTEPGLAIAERNPDGWTVYLPSTPGWDAAVQKLPPDLMPGDSKSAWLDQYSEHLELSNLGPFTGYLLPWAAGEQNYLTRSITHGIGGSMHYAFDFAKPGYPSDMFSIYASKGGFVKWVIWTYPNGYDDGNCNHQNYIVIEHPSTTPTTYSMYIHLAQDSIPVPLRTPGAAVVQGQFIGLADDTGCSSGNHLHLQTHTNPWSYWGSSVDMVFSDVPINGGRPRTPNEAAQYPQHGASGQHLYTSGNVVQGDLVFPQGDILSPQTGDKILTGEVQIIGSASDVGSGLSHSQLKAAVAGTWLDIEGPIPFAAFSQPFDLCTYDIPDGPVSVALQVWDLAGNSSFPEGLTHLNKDYSCPSAPPACIPGPDEAALFSDPVNGGACETFNLGLFTSSDLGSLLPDTAASLILGSNTSVTVFSEDNFQGRSESFSVSDLNFSDNVIASDNVGSLIVAAQGEGPGVPDLAQPASGATMLNTESVLFAWRDGDTGEEYQLELTGPINQTFPWSHEPFVVIGTLPPGAYQWRVRARNGAGNSAWSPLRNLTINADSASIPAPAGVPYLEDFENGAPGWTGSGFWHLTTNTDMVHNGGQSAWYADSTTGNYESGGPNEGSWTSPPISIPAVGYKLRFYYRFDTEQPEGPWDPRWVMISENDGPFEPFYQLQGEEELTWLQSPALNLDQFAGQDIRVRFFIATIDGERNGGDGWAVDDISIQIES
ncbi:MAG: peptidoglycan DD-metalloendopeptidase family protein, partial [Anaerolineales bacterium]|nr:peptidoglycan DD-metalloendopeptidase family protein [Anaerolineales bacterium]